MQVGIDSFAGLMRLV